MFYILLPHIQNSTIYPQNLLKSNILPPKLIKKSMNNLLNEETKLKWNEKHLLSKFKVVTLCKCVRKSQIAMHTFFQKSKIKICSYYILKTFGKSHFKAANSKLVLPKFKLVFKLECKKIVPFIIL